MSDESKDAKTILASLFARKQAAFKALQEADQKLSFVIAEHHSVVVEKHEDLIEVLEEIKSLFESLVESAEKQLEEAEPEGGSTDEDELPLYGWIRRAEWAISGMEAVISGDFMGPTGADMVSIEDELDHLTELMVDTSPNQEAA